MPSPLVFNVTPDSLPPAPSPPGTTIGWSYALLGSVGVQSAIGSVTTIDDIGIKDVAIDVATGDLALPPRYVTGVDAIVQRLSIRFKFWLGEWFLDQRLGIPYIQQVFVKAPDMKLIERLFRRVVSSTPGIATVKAFTMSLDSRTRTLTVTNLQAAIVSGGTLIAKSSPFLVARG